LTSRNDAANANLGVRLGAPYNRAGVITEHRTARLTSR
jgi:hypothetical protein